MYELTPFCSKPPHQGCYLVEGASDGEKYFMKEYNLHAFTKDDHHVQKEARLTGRMMHNLLPTLIEVFVTEGSIFLVEEYIDPGRMTNLLHAGEDQEELKVLSPHAVQNLIKSVVSALQYLHEEGYVLRDLTPGNIMVQKLTETKFDLQIADTAPVVEEGCREHILAHPLYAHIKLPKRKQEDQEEAESEDDSDTAESEKMNNIRYYLPPESVFTRNAAAPAQDMWSLGVLTYLLLCGHLPFDLQHISCLGSEDPQSAIDRQIFAGLFSEPAWAKVSDRCKSFVQALLKVDPDERMTSTQAFRHPFLLIGP